MARRDDRSNTAPSTPDLAANPPERQASTGTLGALGSEPPGPLGNVGFSARPAGAPGQEQGDQGPRDVKQEVKHLASQAKQQTARAAGQAKSQVNQLVARQKNQMAERLRSLADALREAGQNLEEREEGSYGLYAERAAAQVDRASDYLRRQDLKAFVHDLEGFARRHPDVFLGGALIAGVLLARFLKASAEPEPGEDYPVSAYATPPYERYERYDEGYADEGYADEGYADEGYGSTRRYGADTGTYGPSHGTAGGL